MNSVAIIANVQKNGTKGGAEIFHQKLYEYMCRIVPHVELIEVPCSEDTFEGILSCYQECYDLDLSRFDGVISSKAPTFAVSHPNHVCYLMHTIRVFYDMYDEIGSDPANGSRRKLLHRLDRELLSEPRTKRLFTIGQEVSDRIRKYIGLDSTPLHPGMTSEGFFCGPQEDYIFMPGRLHRWKRVDLVIRAMEYVSAPVKLVVAGTGEQMVQLKEMASGNPRIEFTGSVSDSRLKELYADSLAVVFTPVREDYGYILHEAFMSEKPVITCSDSGEPARFIQPGRNGFICEPDPKKIAEAVDFLYSHRDDAARMGVYGKKCIENISWENVAATLLEALEA